MTTQSHLYKQDDEMKLPSCCAHHGFEEGGCNGRNCPEGRVDLRALLTRRQQEAESRWAQDIGVEAADAPRVTGAVPPIVVDDIKPAPFFPPLGMYKPLPTDWSAITRWGAAVAICIVWTLIVIYAR